MSGVVLGTEGLHLLVVTVQWVANSSGGRQVDLIVERDGVPVSQATGINAPTPFGSSVMQVVLMHIAEPEDVVQVEVRQSSGANLDVMAADGRTMLQVWRAAQ